MYTALRQILAESDHIVFFGGAGVSTESGIPDFRSEDGSFKALERYGRPPEELLSIEFFRRDPAVFYRYYRESLLGNGAAPNAAHHALALLEEKGRLQAVVTQNIDGLHQRAGSRAVYELHGSVGRHYCADCGREFSVSFILEAGEVPRCGCGGVVRPDVVLYGEMLDEAVIDGAVQAISRADVLIVGGTSLVVYPAAGLLRYFTGRHLVLINRDETPYDDRAHLVIRQSIGGVLGDAVENLYPNEMKTR